MSFSLQSLAPETRINVPTSALLDHFKATTATHSVNTILENNSNNNFHSFSNNSNKEKYNDKDKDKDKSRSTIIGNIKENIGDEIFHDDWENFGVIEQKFLSDSRIGPSTLFIPEVIDIDDEDENLEMVEEKKENRKEEEVWQEYNTDDFDKEDRSEFYNNGKSADKNVDDYNGDILFVSTSSSSSSSSSSSNSAQQKNSLPLELISTSLSNTSQPNGSLCTIAHVTSCPTPCGTDNSNYDDIGKGNDNDNFHLNCSKYSGKNKSKNNDNNNNNNNYDNITDNDVDNSNDNNRTHSVSFITDDYNSNRAFISDSRNANVSHSDKRSDSFSDDTSDENNSNNNNRSRSSNISSNNSNSYSSHCRGSISCMTRTLTLWIKAWSAGAHSCEGNPAYSDDSTCASLNDSHVNNTTRSYYNENSAVHDKKSNIKNSMKNDMKNGMKNNLKNGMKVNMKKGFSVSEAPNEKQFTVLSSYGLQLLNNSQLDYAVAYIRTLRRLFNEMYTTDERGRKARDDDSDDDISNKYGNKHNRNNGNYNFDNYGNKDNNSINDNNNNYNYDNNDDNDNNKNQTKALNLTENENDNEEEEKKKDTEEEDGAEVDTIPSLWREFGDILENVLQERSLELYSARLDF